ncbi:hypothetical protein [Streptomyces orinoci]|uniref:Secreted protein n=1 Tax=Streptomyces orinoci TaxID=67339 RepID=A0ABV3K211_STRON|nr:hypothetical protein [Streptomyces orinoci]
MMLHLRKMAIATVCTAAVAGSLTLGAGMASAGTNGQQIHFQDRRHKVASIWLDGTNQNGQNVQICWMTPSKDTYIRGYWWVDRMDITEFRNRHCDHENNGVVGYLHPKVPHAQDDHWYLVHN